MMQVSDAKLPVLLYHYVGPKFLADRHASLRVSPEDFENQVCWMFQNGYRGITAQQWAAFVNDGASLPFKPVLLTFDDGYADFIDHALPVLQRYSFSATVFVVTRVLPKSWDVDPLMDSDQIRQCAKSGIEIGAHSRTHQQLTRLTVRDLEDEVAGSAEDLASTLGKEVSSFAYPFGFWNDHVYAAVRKSFRLAFTCNEGLNQLETDRHLLRRTMVQPRDLIIDTACRLEFGWSPVTAARSTIRIGTRFRKFKSMLCGFRHRTR